MAVLDVVPSSLSEASTLTRRNAGQGNIDGELIVVPSQQLQLYVHEDANKFPIRMSLRLRDNSWLTWGYNRELENQLRNISTNILKVGLDGQPFAPHSGYGIYSVGLPLNCGVKGFLATLMAVAQQGRIEQFPWIKEILPESTYKHLSGMQIAVKTDPSLPIPAG